MSLRSKFIDGSDATEYQAQLAPLISATADAVTEQEEAELTVYQQHGYKDRDDYLRCMAEDHGASLATVRALADLLGPSEDFDGLVTLLEDYEG